MVGNYRIFLFVYRFFSNGRINGRTKGWTQTKRTTGGQVFRFCSKVSIKNAKCSRHLANISIKNFANQSSAGYLFSRAVIVQTLAITTVATFAMAAVTAIVPRYSSASCEHTHVSTWRRGFNYFRPVPRWKWFSDFCSKFSLVSSFFHPFENFSNFSSWRRDRFGPKIVKIRAILAIFRPFEQFSKNFRPVTDGRFPCGIKSTASYKGMEVITMRSYEVNIFRNIFRNFLQRRPPDAQNCCWKW